jgi:hypothetical protein
MKYKSCFLVIALLAIFARTQSANEPTISLQQDEIAEIMSAQETYAYFGDPICSLQHDLPTLMQLARASGHEMKHLHAIEELVARGYTTAPAYVVKAAVEEAAACIAACTANISAQEMQRIADALEAYDHALQTGAADLVIADPAYAQGSGGQVESDSAHPELVEGPDFAEASTGRQTRGTKKFDNLIVRNQAAVGSLFVGGDEIVNHNLTVNNDLLVRGRLTVLGDLVFSDTHVILSGDQIINGNFTVTGNTTLGTCAAGSINNINGTTNINTVGTCTTTIGNTTNTTTITSTTAVINGNLLVNGTTTITGTSLVVSGDIKTYSNIKLPNVNAAGTQGIVQLGVDPIYLYNAGTSNFYAGDYTSGIATITTGSQNIAIGTRANIALTTQNNTIAIGTNSSATNSSAIALGQGTIASGANSLSLGDASTASGDVSIAIGTAVSSGPGSIAIGEGSSSSGLFSVSINGSASGNGSLALFGNASGLQSVAIRSGTVSGTNAIGMGFNANSLGDQAIALGAMATATGTSFATALGRSASATNNQTIAIGNLAQATQANSIVINATGSALVSTTTGTFISGIYSAQTASGALPVFCDAQNRLGTVQSSKKFKENFRSLDNHSAQIYNLNPVKFDYKATSGGAKDQFGLIAEEVAQHIPEIIARDAQGQIYTIQYHVLPTLLVNEMKHHQRKLDGLTAEVAALKAALNKLK